MTAQKTNKELEHISGILKTTLGKWMSTAGEPVTRIWTLWDDAVGEHIAANARPARLKNHVLIVHVSSSVWIQQLQFSKKLIMDQINSAAGSCLVSDIKFKIEA